MKKQKWWQKEVLPELDLNNKYPGYVNKNVGRFFMVLLLGLVFADFVLNDYSFRRISLECNDVLGCDNPFYLCKDGEQTSYFNYCSTEVPSFICDKGLCDDKKLPYGFQYGRTDSLARYGSLFAWLVLPLILIVNHLVYFFKTGNWRYKKE